MKRTEISFDFQTVPAGVRQYMEGAVIYDSSCSEHAQTLYVKGKESAFLKISKKGTLEREYSMTQFLHGHSIAPKAIAFESDEHNDYFLSEAISGEDGTAEFHLENPVKLAMVFGEYLRMLHSLPTEGCPYMNRTSEMLHEAGQSGKDLSALNEFSYSASDNVVIHGDYCLPNIIMDHFSFKGFIDLGGGGIGDRHYDLFWGIWTLQYNLKTNDYKDVFLDAYGRSDVDAQGLNYFTKLVDLVEWS